ncbi:MAG TPA: SDR family oxidoreductase, partial [Vicinamibacterales bacterium]|nr:SDR family oxidoreductase [Vicinamibacterales bacterium]
MTRPLEGRSALITGASQGLGLGIARAYVAAGASLFLCARDGDALGRARVELERLVSGGQTIRTRSTNVADEADVRALAADAFRAFPTLDILVNNAGVQGP